MRYLNGETIIRGDLCWHAERRQVAQVVGVVENFEDQKRYGVLEFGVLLRQDLSVGKTGFDLFIGEQFFDEEEINPLTDEEKTLLLQLWKLALENLQQILAEDVSYLIRCIDNPVEQRHPYMREWVIKLYRFNPPLDEEYIACNQLSELKKYK